MAKLATLDSPQFSVLCSLCGNKSYGQLLGAQRMQDQKAMEKAVSFLPLKAQHTPYSYAPIPFSPLHLPPSAIDFL
jgi:hypothetical protein